MSKGVETSIVNRRRNAWTKSLFDAPALLRIADTIVAVSSTNRTQPGDIVYDITVKER